METSHVDFDPERLESYLVEEFDAEEVETEIVEAGEINLTVAVTVDDRSNAYILQRPDHRRHDNPLFGDIRMEYSVLQTLQKSSIPVPEPVLFCEDESLIGDVFTVVEHLDGETIESELPDRFQLPERRRKLVDVMLQTLADIHTVDTEDFEPVLDHRDPVQEVELAIGTLDQATSVTGRDLPGLYDAADWLLKNAPERSTNALVHGDYKPLNIIFRQRAQPVIEGIIDWEMASLGDPLLDLGWLLFMWKERNDPMPEVATLESRYPAADDETVEGLKSFREYGWYSFTIHPDTPSRQELVERYETHTGIEFTHQRFYRGLAAFEIAATFEKWYGNDIEAGVDTGWAMNCEYLVALLNKIITGKIDL